MPAETVQTETDVSSELDAPVWSVISFERVESTDIDYRTAAKLLADLESKGVVGLCIVSNAAAARIKTPK